MAKPSRDVLKLYSELNVVHVHVRRRLFETFGQCKYSIEVALTDEMILPSFQNCFTVHCDHTTYFLLYESLDSHAHVHLHKYVF